jgi:NAD(P)-dependent dehydrogenase (short-subunit alcohol dehydrogenase family)
MAADAGRIAFDDLHGWQSYTRYGAYGQSKLANLLFAFELQRRLLAAGSATLSLAAHPGLSETQLQSNTATASGALWERVGYPLMHAVLSQSQAAGALPQLYAATAPDVEPGGFYGPRWRARGAPVAARAPSAAHDAAAAARLWELSEELTRVEYL